MSSEAVTRAADVSRWAAGWRRRPSGRIRDGKARVCALVLLAAAWMAACGASARHPVSSGFGPMPHHARKLMGARGAAVPSPRGSRVQP
jgi:hypothetical protein